MSTNIRIALLLIALLAMQLTQVVFSQDTAYARKVLMKLGSEEFGGRGYVDKGEKLAADYIATNFQNFKLKALSENYFQKFEMAINTIQNVGDFIIEDDTLIPAVDYYISNASTSRSGDFGIVFIDDSLFANDSKYLRDILMQDLSKKFLVFSNPKCKSRYQFMTDVGGLIFLHKADIGYWHFRNAQNPVNYAIIDILEEKIPRTTKEIAIDFTAKFYKEYTTQNVIGYVKGKLHPDSFIAITAHYDHMGKMGEKVYFAGANDNASGTVMLMDLAKYFSDSINQPDYSIVFMAFSGEEVGLLGSTQYARNPLFPLKNIKMLFNLDMVGTGSAGITVVNATVFKKQFELLQKINKEKKYLKRIKSRGESCNSDHCPFYKQGVPSFFIYTMGEEYMEYHTIRDRPEDLPFTKYSELFKLLRDYIEL